MPWRKCEPGCTCGKHHPSEEAKRKRGEGVRRAAEQRRRMAGPLPVLLTEEPPAPWWYPGAQTPTQRAIRGLRLGEQVHRRCHRCGRLLAPIDGLMPLHRVPAERIYEGGAAPLTGPEAPWCEEQQQQREGQSCNGSQPITQTAVAVGAAPK